MAPLTISQLNKLGERLRKGSDSKDDLLALDTFRFSFGEACAQVVDELLRLGLNPSTRPAKTTPSIIAKLNREQSRLSKIQDIAGCRVEVDDREVQDRVVADLVAIFPGASVIDRRLKPSHGYRAVHLVVEIDGYFVEIQVRTSLQHVWASASEKLSDLVDPDIKYGGGPQTVQEAIFTFSKAIAQFEEVEIALRKMPEGPGNKAAVEMAKAAMATFKKDLQTAIRGPIIRAEKAGDQ